MAARIIYQVGNDLDGHPYSQIEFDLDRQVWLGLRDWYGVDKREELEPDDASKILSRFRESVSFEHQHICTVCADLHPLGVRSCRKIRDHAQGMCTDCRLDRIMQTGTGTPTT